LYGCTEHCREISLQFDSELAAVWRHDDSIDELEATSALPEAPEETRVEGWVLDAYRRSWRQ
jgi:hypothetical protein